MAEIQELDGEVGEIEAVEQNDAKIEQTATEAAAEPAEENIPEEFRGMSLAEVARIAKSFKKKVGDQGNEIGEIRKLADELIRSQMKPQTVAEPVKEVDFFENPQEAIRRAVETNPRVLQAEQYAIAAQRAQAKQILEQKHPDFGAIVQDGDFADWVKGSKIRTRLYQEAEAWNVDAADELLSTFKQLKAVKQNTVSDAEKTARTGVLKAAAVETGGSGESSRKVYRRTDLINLKLRDPRKFESMQDEIDAAYREGRVR